MSCVVLDINDASLALWRTGEAPLESPGYALLEGRDYGFGETARSQARLHPQQINHRYWSQLDMEPIVPAFGPARHSADLVHAHLLDICTQAGSPTELMLAAPASLQHDQLALLLGIIEQCPFSATGLVDRAVAAVSGAGAQRFNWHVELQLHQALLTGISFDNGQLQRERVVPIPGSGWLALQDALAKAIADAFIRQTRFDPRRKATTEQALYDQLPGLLQQLQTSNEHNLELGGHRARIEKGLLAEQCANHYQRIARATQEQQGQLLLGQSLVNLPGIDASLPGAIHTDSASIGNTISEYADSIRSDEGGVHFITSLPASANAEPAAPQQTKTPPAAPASTAPASEPVGPSRCQIDIEGSSQVLKHLSGAPPKINGKPATAEQALVNGDIVELEDGSCWQLTQVPAGTTGDNGT